ncbi:hypothetical protein SNEBB_006069 [Seison nebaliae]|nr:hypothetical protein SNEBB_006069 [Seison nebaliae]
MIQSPSRKNIDQNDGESNNNNNRTINGTKKKNDGRNSDGFEEHLKFEELSLVLRCVGSIGGMLIGGILSDLFGRRFTLLLALFLQFLMQLFSFVLVDPMYSISTIHSSLNYMSCEMLHIVIIVLLNELSVSNYRYLWIILWYLSISFVRMLLYSLMNLMLQFDLVNDLFQQTLQFSISLIFTLILFTLFIIHYVYLMESFRYLLANDKWELLTIYLFYYSTTRSIPSFTATLNQLLSILHERLSEFMRNSTFQLFLKYSSYRSNINSLSHQLRVTNPKLHLTIDEQFNESIRALLEYEKMNSIESKSSFKSRKLSKIFHEIHQMYLINRNYFVSSYQFLSFLTTRIVEKHKNSIIILNRHHSSFIERNHLMSEKGLERVSNLSQSKNIITRTWKQMKSSKKVPLMKIFQKNQTKNHMNSSSSFIHPHHLVSDNVKDLKLTTSDQSLNKLSCFFDTSNNYSSNIIHELYQKNHLENEGESLLTGMNSKGIPLKIYPSTHHMEKLHHLIRISLKYEEFTEFLLISQTSLHTPNSTSNIIEKNRNKINNNNNNNSNDVQMNEERKLLKQMYRLIDTNIFIVWWELLTLIQIINNVVNRYRYNIDQSFQSLTNFPSSASMLINQLSANRFQFDQIDNSFLNRLKRCFHNIFHFVCGENDEETKNFSTTLPQIQIDKKSIFIKNCTNAKIFYKSLINSHFFIILLICMTVGSISQLKLYDDDFQLNNNNNNPIENHKGYLWININNLLLENHQILLNMRNLFSFIFQFIFILICSLIFHCILKLRCIFWLFARLCIIIILGECGVMIMEFYYNSLNLNNDGEMANDSTQIRSIFSIITYLLEWFQYLMSVPIVIILNNSVQSFNRGHSIGISCSVLLSTKYLTFMFLKKLNNDVGKIIIRILSIILLFILPLILRRVRNIKNSQSKLLDERLESSRLVHGNGKMTNSNKNRKKRKCKICKKKNEEGQCGCRIEMKRRIPTIGRSISLIDDRRNYRNKSNLNFRRLSFPECLDNIHDENQFNWKECNVVMEKEDEQAHSSEETIYSLNKRHSLEGKNFKRIIPHKNNFCNSKYIQIDRLNDNQMQSIDKRSIQLTSSLRKSNGESSSPVCKCSSSNLRSKNVHFNITPTHHQSMSNNNNNSTHSKPNRIVNKPPYRPPPPSTTTQSTSDRSEIKLSGNRNNNQRRHSSTSDKKIIRIYKGRKLHQPNNKENNNIKSSCL